MSSLTDRIFQAAMEGLLNRDSVLCSQVVADDYEIDILEKQVDRDGVNLLLRFHPVASDMREVISAMKVGDYSISPVIREVTQRFQNFFGGHTRGSQCHA